MMSTVTGAVYLVLLVGALALMLVPRWRPDLLEPWIR